MAASLLFINYYKGKFCHKFAAAGNLFPHFKHSNTSFLFYFAGTHEILAYLDVENKN